MALTFNIRRFAFVLLFLHGSHAVAGSRAEQTPGGANELEEMDPYHVIQIHLEEGSEDPLDTRRAWEEAKAEKKRTAQLVEREQRTISKFDAAAAAQHAQIA